MALRNLKDAQGRRIKAAAGLPRAARPQARPAGRGAPRSFRAAVRHARAGGHRAQGPLPGLGLHRREPRGPQRPCAQHPQPGVRGARRYEPRRPGRPRVRSRSSSRTPTCRTSVPDEAEADGRRDLGDSIRISGNITRALLPQCPGLPAGLGVQHRPGRPAAAHPGQHHARERGLRDPEDPAARPAAPVALRPRAARRLRARSPAATCERWRTSTASCSARPTGRACRRSTCRTCSTLLQDLSRFPTLADRAQQGFVNFMYVGPLDAEARLGRRRRRPVAAVLRRQLPGRHHGRRADGAGARLRPRRARRAGHELLHAAAALGGLRPLRARQHRGRRHAARALRLLPERARAPAAALADPAALGPRARRTATPTTSRATRFRARRRTTCSCTWRSATTRLPT